MSGDGAKRRLIGEIRQEEDFWRQRGICADWIAVAPPPPSPALAYLQQLSLVQGRLASKPPQSGGPG